MSARPVNVVAVYAAGFWQHKHSIVRRHVIEAMLQHPDLNTVLTGPGWDNYHVEKSLQENVDRLMPEADVIYLYKPDGNPKRGVPALVAPEHTRQPKVMRFHEFWWTDDPQHRQQAVQETRDCRLALCTHQNDLDRVLSLQNGTDAAHAPQTADPETFRCDRPIAERPINCLLTGTVQGYHYPLREKLKRVVASNAVPGEIRRHPGYWIADPQREVESYAEQLANAKIALCCSSRWRYALGKMVESAMAGCVVATDMPDDSLFRDTLGRHVIELDASWSREKIASVLNSWLGDPDALQRKADALRSVALEHYTHRRWCDNFVEAVRSRGLA